ncbi:MAG: hypothetical protein ACRDFB_03330 [Rhabdochlamydiaceae bacterium]
MPDFQYTVAPETTPQETAVALPESNFHYTSAPMDQNQPVQPNPELPPTLENNYMKSAQQLTGQTLQDNYNMVSATNQNKNAAIVNTANKTGMPLDSVAQNSDAATTGASAPSDEFWDGLQKNNPALASWLQDPKNMAISHEELKPLQQTDSMFNYISKASLNLTSNALRVLDLPDRLLSDATGFNPTTPYSFEHAAQLLDTAANNISTPDNNMEYTEALSQAVEHGNLQPLANKLASNIPELATLLGGGLAINGAKVLGTVITQKLAERAVAGYVGAQTIADSMEQSRKLGTPTAEAWLAASVKGSVAGASMMLPMHYFGKVFGKLADQIGAGSAKDVMKLAVKNYIGTALGLTAQNDIQFLTNSAVNKITGEDPHAFDNFGEKFANANVGGLVGGLTLGLPHVALGAMAKLPEQENLDKAQNVKKSIVDLIKSRTKMSFENPEGFKSLVQEFHQHYPNTENVYVDKDDFEKFYQDEKPEEAAKHIGPETEKSFLDPSTSDIKIPISELLTIKPEKIKDISGLADSMKLNQNDQSVNEATESKNNVTSEKGLENEKDQLKEIAEDIGSQAKGVKQPKSIGKLVANFYKAQAARTGQTIAEVQRRFKFVIAHEDDLKEMSSDYKDAEPFKNFYEKNSEFASPLDYARANKTKLLVTPEDKDSFDKLGGIESTSDENDKTAKTPNKFAEELKKSAGKKVDKSSLPSDWFTSGEDKKPDFPGGVKDVHNLLSRGSALEELSKIPKEPLNISEISKEAQLHIFGNESKPETENKETIKTSESGKRNGSYEPGFFQRGADYFNHFNRRARLGPRLSIDEIKADQYRTMGAKPAVQDPITGRIFTAEPGTEGHAAAHKMAQFIGIKKLGVEHEGFKLNDGTFLTRKEADKQLGISKTYQLSQGHRGYMIPAYDPAKDQHTFTIFVNKDTDKSTLFHEIAHGFLYALARHSMAPSASDKLKLDGQTALDFLGAKEWGDLFKYTVDSEGKYHLSAESRAMHEKFARGFEYRLWEGNIPVPGLKRVFDRFMQYVREVYPSAEIMAKYLGVDLSPRMRGVYDRMIATQDEISEATKKMGYDAEFPQGISAKDELQMMESYSEAIRSDNDRLLAAKMKSYMAKGLDAEMARRKAEDKIKYITEAEAVQRHLEDLIPPDNERESESYKIQEEKANEEVGKQSKWDVIDSFKSKFDKNPRDEARKFLTGEAPEYENFFEFEGAKHGYDSAQSIAYAVANADWNREVEDNIKQTMALYKPYHYDPVERGVAATLGSEDHLIAMAIHQLRLVDSFKDENSANFNSLKDTKDQKKLDSFKNKINDMFDSLKNTEGNKYEDQRKGIISEIESSDESAKSKISSALESISKVSENFKKETDDLKKFLDELSIVKKTTKKVNLEAMHKLMIEVKTQANEILNQKHYGDAANFRSFITSAKKFASKGAIAEKAGDYKKSAIYKRNEMLNHELAKQAIRNKDIVRKSVSSIDGLAHLTDMTVKGRLKIDLSSALPIRKIIEGYGFSKKLRMPTLETRQIEASKMQSKLKDPASPTKDELSGITSTTGLVKENGVWKEEGLSKFFDRMKRSDAQIGIAPYLDSGLLDALGKIKNEDLTLNDLKNISSACRSIYSNSIKTKDFYLPREGQTVEGYCKIASDSMKAATRLPRADREALLKMMNNIVSSWDRFQGPNGQIDTLVQYLDGGTDGPLHRGILRPLAALSSRIEDLTEKRVKEHLDIAEKHFPGGKLNKRLNQKVDIKMRSGNVRQFKIYELYEVMRNIGNFSGYKDIVRGNGFDDATLERMKEKLEEPDMNYIRDIAQADENYFPEYQAQELKLNGVLVDPLEKRPVLFKGKIYDGWYYHKSYDSNFSSADIPVEENLRDDLSDFKPIAVQPGFVKARVEMTGKPVKLDGSVHQKYMKDTIHYLCTQETCRDVRKILDNKLFRKTLEDAITVKGAKAFDNTLQYLDKGAKSPVGWIERSLRYTRISQITYNIAFRPAMFFVKYLSDLNHIAFEKSPILAAQILVRNGINPWNGDLQNLIDKINEKSLEMKQLNTMFSFDAKSLHDYLSGKPRIQAFVDMTSYFTERMANRIVAYNLWDHTYTEAIKGGKDEMTSRDMAMESVRRILSTNNPITHTFILRGSEVMKSLSPAFHYFATIQNRAWLDGKKVGRAVSDKNYLLASYVVAQMVTRFIIVPGLINYGIRGAFKNSQNESDKKKRDQLLVSLGTAPLDYIPGAHNVGNYFFNHAFNEETYPLELLPAEEFMANGIFTAIEASKTAFGAEPLTEKHAKFMINYASQVAKVPKIVDTLSENLWDDTMENQPAHWQDFFSPKKQ